MRTRLGDVWFFVRLAFDWGDSIPAEPEEEPATPVDIDESGEARSAAP